ncbi:MAG: T9SS type A sorting domain-containing protein [Flavobacteriales bacterium]|nr:T9SS type A sorting domain-containing protein [Flavobacteriales bacterium]MCB9165667.1 T9SS type A sorting domain-containing protein [Flavobacteriales bacterium]HPF91659.1 T9SS type A sorting domain-containing protein [Flavobacteriales bacterium]
MLLLRTSILSALLGLGAWQCAQAQQGLNNLWTGGYASWAGPPNGGLDLDFFSGPLELTYVDRDIGFRQSSTNITDLNGVLQFATNGSFLSDMYGDTLTNGTGINPSAYTSDFANGLELVQPALIIPQPVVSGIYYLIHGTVDNQGSFTAQYLYLSVIDMSLNGGLGAVVIKNQVLIDDALNAGKITAVRHANGRDWWVFCHKAFTNTYYRLLVRPTGVTVDGTQSIGIVRPADAGQVCFSPDGTKFAYYWGVEDLEILDFDRCTGLFSNPVFISIDDDNANSGVAFSPNSRYLYVSSASDCYQYDTEAADITASMVHIAQWDGFYSPSPPFATGFDVAQLANDGKVYFGTGNSTFHLHVVHNPDVGGVGCNMEQHGVELPVWFSNSLANHPNYHLGPVDGSVCDSLDINVGVAPLSSGEGLGVRVYPNPSAGACTVQYAAQPTAGVLEVRDLAGKLVLREKLPAWSQVHQVVLEGAAGLYNCQLVWGEQRVSTRIVMVP